MERIFYERRKTEEVVLHEAIISAKIFLGRYLEENPQSYLKDNMQIFCSALDGLQVDSLDDVKRVFGPRPWKKFSINERTIIALLIANVFNKGDDRLEIATDHSLRTGAEIGSSLLYGIFQNGIAAKRISDVATREDYVSPSEMLTHIKLFADDIGIDTKYWGSTINEIMKAQASAMDKISEVRTVKNITYTVSEAVKYRKDTIGNYARMLSKIIYLKNFRERIKGVRNVMRVQAIDDIQDIGEDAFTQMNPFVALLSKFRMLDDYIYMFDGGVKVNKILATLISENVDLDKEMEDVRREYVRR